jgi:hypothetical protein
MPQAATSTLIGRGAVAGAVWFLVALVFDKGVHDLNTPLIPTSGIPAVLASLIGGAVTGIAVALVFRRSWVSESRLVRAATPLAALIVGITVFSVFVWIARLMFGAPSSARPAEQFVEVLGTFAVYGLLSVFAPVAYLIAWLTQTAIRKSLRRET